MRWNLLTHLTINGVSVPLEIPDAEIRALIPAPEHGDWMNTRQAAAYLGTTANALHKHTQAKTIPFHQDRPNGRCWFRKAELDEWRKR